MTTEAAVARVRRALDRYRFRAVDEHDLQRQVAECLADDQSIELAREVIAERGRYDIFVRCDGARLVLELKVKGSAAEVERQAQRYAMTEGVDAVLLVTTSRRLAAQLRAGGPTLGGKPFEVIALRTVF